MFEEVSSVYSLLGFPNRKLIRERDIDHFGRRYLIRNHAVGRSSEEESEVPMKSTSITVILALEKHDVYLSFNLKKSNSLLLINVHVLNIPKIKLIYLSQVHSSKTHEKKREKIYKKCYLLR